MDRYASSRAAERVEDDVAALAGVFYRTLHQPTGFMVDANHSIRVY
ncbi:MAG: hypothetical protein U1E36_02370 [Rickettsiales bacterium]